jgi:hypothetical protein
MTEASPGRIVHYTLSEADEERINARRDADPQSGNRVKAGDVVPAIVVRVWADRINGQAFLDGADTLWLTSRAEGTTPGTWAWPQAARTDPGTSTSTELVLVGENA